MVGFNSLHLVFCSWFRLDIKDQSKLWFIEKPFYLPYFTTLRLRRYCEELGQFYRKSQSNPSAHFILNRWKDHLTMESVSVMEPGMILLVIQYPSH